MTTDIRAEASKAAREWWDHVGKLPRDMQPDPVDAFEMGHLSGHAAGYADGARAFAEMLQRRSDDAIANKRIEVLPLGTLLDLFLASLPAPGTGLAQGKDEEGA